ncbi:hypothetical protein R6Q59_030408 [Mikania micrantha]
MDSSCSNSNMDTTKESFMPKIIKKKNVEDDDEFGVFGAQKYFKGLTSASYDNGLHRHRNRSHEEQLSDSKTMSSVRSDSSWNSRKGLLVSDFGKKTSLIKRWLDCNCNDKDSVKIKDAKQPVKSGDSGHKTKSFSSRWADHHKHVNSIKEDPFMSPVVNTAITDSKRTKLPESEQKLKGKTKKSFSFNEATPKTENGREIDTGSDASSDLFEIESFLANENNSFLDRQTIKNNMYAPSEASVNRSVVTLGVSDPSQDLTVATKQWAFSDKSVSRCTSLNALRVSGDEHGMIGVVTDEIEGRGYGTVSGTETPKGESGATGWNEPHR